MALRADDLLGGRKPKGLDPGVGRKGKNTGLLEPQWVDSARSLGSSWPTVDFLGGWSEVASAGDRSVLLGRERRRRGKKGWAGHEERGGEAKPLFAEEPKSHCRRIYPDLVLFQDLHCVLNKNSATK